MIGMSAEARAIVSVLPKYDPFAYDPEKYNFYFDEAKARAMVMFIETYCTHVEGKLAGQPYILEPHEKAIIYLLFGMYRGGDHTRRYRKLFYLVPRKNSKTTFIACLIIAILALDPEPGAQNYCAAADAEQAGLLFRLVKLMIAANGDLQETLKPWQRVIERINQDNPSQPGDAFLKVLSSTADTKHGQNCQTVILDELHVVDEELVDVLVTGQANREQPLVIEMSTAAPEGENICNEEQDYAEDVLKGTVDDPYLLPVIYKAEKDDDWRDPAVWAKANPNLGKSVKLEYIQEACKKAERNPRFENKFRLLHLNQRVESLNRWIPLHVWDPCARRPGEPASPREWRAMMRERFKGQGGWAGFDIGSVSDLTAFVVLFKQTATIDDKSVDLIYQLPWFWIPEHGKWRESKYRQSYEGWINEGFITLTSGNVADHEEIEAGVVDICKTYRVKAVSVDTGHQAAGLCQKLSQHHGIEMFDCNQGYSHMWQPSLEFERLVTGGYVVHGANPVMRWMAGNVTIKYSAVGNQFKPVKPEKERGRYEQKIDGISATIMAIRQFAADQSSNYFATLTRI